MAKSKINGKTILELEEYVQKNVQRIVQTKPTQEPAKNR